MISAIKSTPKSRRLVANYSKTNNHIRFNKDQNPPKHIKRHPLYLHSTYYGSIPFTEFLMLITVDRKTVLLPEEKAKIGPFAKWLLKISVTDKFFTDEILHSVSRMTVTRCCVKYYKYGSHLTKNLYEYESVVQLLDDIESIEERLGKSSQAALSRRGKQKAYSIAVENESWIAYRPHTYEALNKLSKLSSGKPTAWCTNVKNTYRNYMRNNGQLYIIKSKNSEKMFQFQPGSMTMLDQDNAELHISDFDKSAGNDLNSIVIACYNEFVQHAENMFVQRYTPNKMQLPEQAYEYFSGIYTRIISKAAKVSGAISTLCDDKFGAFAWGAYGDEIEKNINYSIDLLNSFDNSEYSHDNFFSHMEGVIRIASNNEKFAGILDAYINYITANQKVVFKRNPYEMHRQISFVLKLRNHKSTPTDPIKPLNSIVFEDTLLRAMIFLSIKNKEMYDTINEKVFGGDASIAHLSVCLLKFISWPLHDRIVDPITSKTFYEFLKETPFSDYYNLQAFAALNYYTLERVSEEIFNTYDESIDNEHSASNLYGTGPAMKRKFEYFCDLIRLYADRLKTNRHFRRFILKKVNFIFLLYKTQELFKHYITGNNFSRAYGMTRAKFLATVLLANEGNVKIFTRVKNKKSKLSKTPSLKAERSIVLMHELFKDIELDESIELQDKCMAMFFLKKIIHNLEKEEALLSNANLLYSSTLNYGEAQQPQVAADIDDEEDEENVLPDEDYTLAVRKAASESVELKTTVIKNRKISGLLDRIINSISNFGNSFLLLKLLQRASFYNGKIPYIQLKDLSVTDFLTSAVDRANRMKEPVLTAQQNNPVAEEAQLRVERVQVGRPQRW